MTNFGFVLASRIIASLLLAAFLFVMGAQAVHTHATEICVPTHADVEHADAAHADPSHADASHADRFHADASHADRSHTDPSHADPSHAALAHLDAAEHADEDGCAFCDVVKERVAIVVTHGHMIVATVGVYHQPVVRTFLDDRCPQERKGRAPPQMV